jgi:biopolymer transport protein ExbB
MTLLDYLDKGGVIMYILAFLSIVGVSVLVWKFLVLLNIKNKIFNISENIAKSSANHSNLTSIESIKNDISLYMLKLEKGMETVKTISTVAPLLGLLGTVIGILDSFEKIANKGMNASFFASGISLALITTIGGLIVAIPNNIGYNYLVKTLDFIELSINKKVIEIINEKKVEAKS